VTVNEWLNVKSVDNPVLVHVTRTRTRLSRCRRTTHGHHGRHENSGFDPYLTGHDSLPPSRKRTTFNLGANDPREAAGDAFAPARQASPAIFQIAHPLPPEVMPCSGAVPWAPGRRCRRLSPTCGHTKSGKWLGRSRTSEHQSVGVTVRRTATASCRQTTDAAGEIGGRIPTCSVVNVLKPMRRVNVFAPQPYPLAFP